MEKKGYLRKWVIYELPSNAFKVKTKKTEIQSTKPQQDFSNSYDTDEYSRPKFTPNPRNIQNLNKILEKGIIFQDNLSKNLKDSPENDKDDRLVLLKYTVSKKKAKKRVSKRKSIVFSEKLKQEKASETGISRFVINPRAIDKNDDDEIDKRINEAVWHF